MTAQYENQLPPEDHKLVHCVECDKEMYEHDAIVVGDGKLYTFCPSCFQSYMKTCSEYTAKFIWLNLRWQ